MPTQTLLSKKNFLLATLFIAGFWAFSVFAQSISITFPVAELGNCASKSECRAYCDIDGPFAEDLTDSQKGERRDACQSFASSRRLGNKQPEAVNKFNVVKEDGGPGGSCGKEKDPIFACKTYCDSTAHVSECVAYAKKHNLFEGKELKEAELVSLAIKNGVKLPPACKDADSCKKVCQNPEDLVTAKQCFAFADAAGLLPKDFDKNKAEIFFKTIEEGKGEFKSFKDFRRCEKPENDEVLKECIKFGEENGFISKEEADLARQTGGKGPGGCRGEECRAYCDSEEHQDECQKFSEEHNLVRPEQKAQMGRGLEQMKRAIGEAPEGVRECIKNSLGGDTLDQIISGTKRPSRDIGEKMRTCFDSFFSREDRENEGGRNLDMEMERAPARTGTQFPPDVLTCLKNKLGADAVIKLQNPAERPSKDFEGAVRGCFNDMGPKEKNPQAGERAKFPDYRDKQEYKEMPPPGFRGNYQEPREGIIHPPIPPGSMYKEPSDDVNYRLIPPNTGTGDYQKPPAGTVVPIYAPATESNIPPPPPPSETASPTSFLFFKSLLANVASLFAER